jgi:hypothetical protein
MRPKEKAKELCDKYYEYADSNYVANKFEKNWYGNVLSGERKVRKSSAKQCALIAIDEILKICVDSLGLTDLDYWLDVKQEIEKL